MLQLLYSSVYPLKSGKKEYTSFHFDLQKITVIGVLMIAIMLTAREALMLRGVNWEFVAFIVLYFKVIQYARILDENEMDIIGEIFNQ